MGKVLVKSAMYQYQMGPDGLQRYYTLGGSGGRAQPGEVRGRTKRNRVSGLTGALAGAAFGLAGESRSAGGFAGNIISGAEQGSRFGRGLADLATSRRRQELANLQEQSKIDRAKEAAQRDFQRRQALNPERLAVEGPRLTSLLNPMNINRRRFEAEQGQLQQARETNQRTLDANEQLGRDLASLGKEKLARDKRDARARGVSLDEHRATREAYDMAQNVDPAALTHVQQLMAGNVMGTPLQQPQMPQGEIPPAEGGAQTQSNANNNAMGTGPQAVQSHTNPSTEAAEQEEQEQQGGRDEEGDPDMLNRLRGMMEGENE
jgi:hypothetical protein